MAKKIFLRNTTASDIEITEVGETVVSSVGSPLIYTNLSHIPAVDFRKVQNLSTYITNGDIVVNDGDSDLPDYIGYEYLINDTTPDEDGFWYGKRRRFSILWQQPNHGFSVGQVVKLDADTAAAVLALADSHANSATTAFVAEIVDENSFYAGLTGSTIRDINQMAVVETLPLIKGKAYFLSSTEPGKITLQPPVGAGEIVKLAGVAIGDTTLMGFTYTGYKNETAVVENTEIQALQEGAAYVRAPNTWQRMVISMNVSDPSALTPTNGDRYIVAQGASGAWTGMDNSIVEFVSSTGAWHETPSVRGFATMVSDIDEFYKFDGTAWVLGSTAPTSNIPDVCYRHNGSVTQTFTHSYSTIIIGSDVKTDASTYTVSNNEVTVLKSGWYKIEYDVSADAISWSRSSMEHVLEKNATAIPGSLAYSYHRAYTSGEDTAHATIWVNLAANDIIRVRSKELAGNTITKINACRLTLEYYG